MWGSGERERGGEGKNGEEEEGEDQRVGEEEGEGRREDGGYKDVEKKDGRGVFGVDRKAVLLISKS